MMAVSELRLDSSGLQEKIRIKSGEEALWGCRYFLRLLDPRRADNLRLALGRSFSRRSQPCEDGASAKGERSARKAGEL